MRIDFETSRTSSLWSYEIYSMSYIFEATIKIYYRSEWGHYRTLLSFHDVYFKNDSLRLNFLCSAWFKKLKCFRLNLAFNIFYYDNLLLQIGKLLYYAQVFVFYKNSSRLWYCLTWIYILYSIKRDFIFSRNPGEIHKNK